jgi:hypothetical protein
MIVGYPDSPTLVQPRTSRGQRARVRGRSSDFVHGKARFTPKVRLAEPRALRHMAESEGLVRVSSITIDIKD